MKPLEKIDLLRFKELEDAGYIFTGRHPRLPLLIHNYSPKAQYERFWTPETLLARGLITDLGGKVVARPFAKFFNWDEHEGLYGELPVEPFEVFEKMDGSLGILYHSEEGPLIATRGSFASEQALRANEILRQKYNHVRFEPHLTYLFEIIYPENRIVVDYGGQEDLVLLAIVDTSSGVEMQLPEDWEMSVVRRYDGIRSLADLSGWEAENREGFVVRFQSGVRVKVKFEEYVRLHRIVTGLSKRTVWYHLSSGQTLSSMLERVPDEFFQWVEGIEDDFRERFGQIEDAAKARFREFQDRKEAAAYFLQTKELAPVLFRMLDRRPYDDIIWRMIKPGHEKGFAGRDREE